MSNTESAALAATHSFGEVVGGHAPSGTLEVAAEAQAKAEIVAAYLAARSPEGRRQIAGCQASVMESFGIPQCAALAQYSFPRGGSTIKGPSVDLAREVARCFGNVRYGVRVMEETRTHVHLRAWALDLESGVQVELDDKFEKRIQRRVKGGQSQWIVVTDERDLRELVNRRGALAERNCLLKVLPSWLVTMACEQADKTLREGLSRAGSLAQQRRAMVDAFSGLAVTPDMLERWGGCKLEELTAEQVQELKLIWKSLDDGNSRREEYFKTEAEARAAEPKPATPAPEAPDLAPVPSLEDLEKRAALERAQQQQDPKPKSNSKLAAELAFEGQRILEGADRTEEEVSKWISQAEQCVSRLRKSQAKDNLVAVLEKVQADDPLASVPEPGSPEDQRQDLLLRVMQLKHGDPEVWEEIHPPVFMEHGVTSEHGLPAAALQRLVEQFSQ